VDGEVERRVERDVGHFLGDDLLEIDEHLLALDRIVLDRGAFEQRVDLGVVVMRAVENGTPFLKFFDQ